MAYTDSNGVILNKGLTIAQYNSKVASGEISSNDVATQLFDLTDDLPVSQTEKNNWNAKSDFSGSYDDLTDKPTIPNVSGFETKTDASNKLAEAKSYADTKVANLVGAAPTTLDTLQELAEAFQDNEEVVEALNSAIGNKVDKVTGKSLVSDTEITKLATIAENANYYVLPSDVVQDSSYVHTDNNYSSDEKAKVAANTNARHTHTNLEVLNNTTASYTTAEKTKLSGIATGAEVNTIESVKVNGVAQTITNKSVNIEVPTVITRIWS